MNIRINEEIRLELIKEEHAALIFDRVNRNRGYLKKWLSFIDAMSELRFAEEFVKRSMEQYKDGRAAGFVIFYKEEMVGRIGVYKIEPYNRIGEIGYWLTENAQGKGIVTKACKALISFCFKELKLNRLEIKCGTENKKSQAIPERIGFTKEGIIRQGEFLYDHFIDLYLYSLLQQEQN